MTSARLEPSVECETLAAIMHPPFELYLARECPIWNRRRRVEKARVRLGEMHRLEKN
jgi:hypothetical protein